MNRTLSSFGRASRGLGLAFLAGMFALAPAAWAQQSFPTPDAAAAAFVDSLARSDDDATKAVLGPDWRKYVPADDVKANDITNFLEAWSKSHRIVPAGDAKAYLEVGTHGWTLPIPIEKTAAGWRFDTKGTPDELRTRRIGRNELDVIQVVLALTDAQEDYSAYAAASTGSKQFAQKILSSPGKRDGLYWATLAGEPPSPLGPIAEGSKRGQAYHGYHYKILTAQGKAAPGRREELPRQRPDDGRLRRGGLAREIRRHRRHDLHHRPQRRRVPEEPRREDRRDREGDDGIRSGFELDEGRADQVAARNRGPQGAVRPAASTPARTAGISPPSPPAPALRRPAQDDRRGAEARVR